MYHIVASAVISSRPGKNVNFPPLKHGNFFTTVQLLPVLQLFSFKFTSYLDGIHYAVSESIVPSSSCQLCNLPYPYLFLNYLFSVQPTISLCFMNFISHLCNLLVIILSCIEYFQRIQFVIQGGKGIEMNGYILLFKRSSCHIVVLCNKTNCRFITSINKSCGPSSESINRYSLCFSTESYCFSTSPI